MSLCPAEIFLYLTVEFKAKVTEAENDALNHVYSIENVEDEEILGKRSK